MLISLEGIDFCGKTTQAALLKSKLEASGHSVTLCHEPGNTPLGIRLREILKDSTIMMTPLAELFLFNASRAELLSKVVCPALQKGDIVIMDRFFHSTLAYQGYGRGIPMDVVEPITQTAVNDTIPNLTIFFNISIQSVAARKERHKDKVKGDTFDKLGPEFFERVINGFLSFTSYDHDHRYVVINADRGPNDVHCDIMQLIDVTIP